MIYTNLVCSREERHLESSFVGGEINRQSLVDASMLLGIYSAKFQRNRIIPFATNLKVTTTLSCVIFLQHACARPKFLSRNL